MGDKNSFEHTDAAFRPWKTYCFCLYYDFESIVLFIHTIFSKRFNWCIKNKNKTSFF
jgi:hypothetical protein